MFNQIIHIQTYNASYLNHGKVHQGFQDMNVTSYVEMAILHTIITHFSSLNSPSFFVLLLFLLDQSHLPKPVSVKEYSFCSSPTCSSKSKPSHCKLLKTISNFLFFISIFFFLLSSWAGGRKKRVSVDWLIGRCFSFGSYPERLGKYSPSLSDWQ